MSKETTDFIVHVRFRSRVRIPNSALYTRSSWAKGSQNVKRILVYLRSDVGILEKDGGYKQYNLHLHLLGFSVRSVANIAAPFIDCSKEQRSVIRFLWSECVKLVKFMEKLLHYGDNCMSQREVYEWAKRFKGGRTSVDARSVRPSPRTCVEDIRKRSIIVSETTE
jgi:hypothetical protein